jgi:hypothetical protein
VDRMYVLYPFLCERGLENIQANGDGTWIASKCFTPFCVRDDLRISRLTEMGRG